MKWKQHDAELKDALGFLNQIKFRAYTDRNTCSKPGNPFKPIPGMEKEFEEAANTIMRVDVIRWELDNRLRRRRIIYSITKKIPEALLFIVLNFGLMLLFWMGAAFISLYFEIKPFAVISGLLFTAVLAEAISLIKTRKRRKHRK